MAPTLRTALCTASARLREAGIGQPAREARLLLALALQLPAGRVPPADAEVPHIFWNLLDRRAAREPMARLRGIAGFWTLDLALSPETLIPRADSEAVIEAALVARPDRRSVEAVLDLGTGSGALLLATLAEYPAAWGVGVDRSPGACAQAARNATANRLAGRASFVCADWGGCLAGRFDLVLCNPPYVTRGELAGLMPEVALHDPHAALDGGPDGLDAYRAVAPALPGLLARSGHAILEHGAGQASAVADLLHAAGLARVGVRADLAGLQRVIVVQKAVGAA